jgi:hypothetical protein
VVTTGGVSSGTAVPVATTTPVTSPSAANPVASTPSTSTPAVVSNSQTASSKPVISAPRHLTSLHGVAALHSIKIAPGGNDKSLLKVTVTGHLGKFRIPAAKGHGAAHTVSSVTLTGSAATVNRAINRLVFVPNSAPKSHSSITIVASVGTQSSRATITIIKPLASHAVAAHPAR